MFESLPNPHPLSLLFPKWNNSLSFSLSPQITFPRPPIIFVTSLNSFQAVHILLIITKHMHIFVKRMLYKKLVSYLLLYPLYKISFYTNCFLLLHEKQPTFWAPLQITYHSDIHSKLHIVTFYCHFKYSFICTLNYITGKYIWFLSRLYNLWLCCF